MKNKTTSILLIMICLILILSGLSYAYFLATTNGNDDAKNTTINTATLSLLYTDGEEINVDNIIPGDSITKTFKVQNTSTIATKYTIYLSELVNNFVDKSDLVYTLTSGDGGANIVESKMPVESSAIASDVDIAYGATHNYVLKITFLNKNIAQDTNQGKLFTAKVQINDVKDAMAPTIINKNITYSSITKNSTIVSWQAASDTYTDVANLKYYVCMSMVNDITMDNCVTKALKIGNNALTYTANSLESNTTYYFGVVVENKYGLKSMYNTSSVTTEKEITVWGEKYEIASKTDLVGINYSTWFNYMHYKTPTTYNVTNILAGNGSWGNVGDFHYWGEPALGYYNSTDTAVIRQHLTDIYNAGIDFIIIDNTNVLISWIGGTGVFDESSVWYKAVTAPMKALLDTAVAMRNEGLPTPYFVNWVNTNDDYTVLNVMHNLFTSTTYDTSLGNDKYVNLWVYWNDKPFFLITKNQGTPDRDITYRVMWGLQTATSNGEWTYLQQDNRNPYGKDNSGVLEQMGVSTAIQKTRMTNTSTALGRNHGVTMAAQWYNAYNKRPKFITITWWNEWGAERLAATDPACTTICFTDNYNQEYSRDIEPMKNGHGSEYYNWTKQYISDYKNHTGYVKYAESGY